MNSPYTSKHKEPKQKFLFILGSIILLLYFSLGLLFLCYKNMPFDMSPLAKTGFGILLIAYAVFRFFRLVKGFKTHS